MGVGGANFFFFLKKKPKRGGFFFSLFFFFKETFLGKKIFKIIFHKGVKKIKIFRGERDLFKLLKGPFKIKKWGILNFWAPGFFGEKKNWFFWKKNWFGGFFKILIGGAFFFT
jgi:hypothetical protein